MVVYTYYPLMMLAFFDENLERHAVKQRPPSPLEKEGGGREQQQRPSVSCEDACDTVTVGVCVLASKTDRLLVQSSIHHPRPPSP